MISILIIGANLDIGGFTPSCETSMPQKSTDLAINTHLDALRVMPFARVRLKNSCM